MQVDVSVANFLVLSAPGNQDIIAECPSYLTVTDAVQAAPVFRF